MKAQAFEYLISSQRLSHINGAVARLVGTQFIRDSATSKLELPMRLPDERDSASPKVFKYQLELPKPKELQRHLDEQRRLLEEGRR